MQLSNHRLLSCMVKNSEEGNREIHVQAGVVVPYLDLKE